MIRLTLPFHLRRLANLPAGDIPLDVPAPITITAILNTLESQYPMLRGTIRDHGTTKRRDFIRFFADAQDLSNDPPDTPLPPAIASGAKPFMIVGALAGG